MWYVGSLWIWLIWSSSKGEEFAPERNFLVRLIAVGISFSIYLFLMILSNVYKENFSVMHSASSLTTLKTWFRCFFAIKLGILFANSQGNIICIVSNGKDELKLEPYSAAWIIKRISTSLYRLKFRKERERNRGEWMKEIPFSYRNAGKVKENKNPYK